MKRFVIFYCSDHYYESVVVDAESLDAADDIARGFSRAYAVTILGVFLQSALTQYFNDCE